MTPHNSPMNEASVIGTGPEAKDKLQQYGAMVGRGRGRSRGRGRGSGRILGRSPSTRKPSKVPSSRGLRKIGSGLKVGHTISLSAKLPSSFSSSSLCAMAS